MPKDVAIFVAGADKVIGKAVIKTLETAGYTGIIRSKEPDLTDQTAVNHFFDTEKPQWVILAAGKSGGISFNRSFPADLIYDNLMVASNVIYASHGSGVDKLLYLASSCSYPRLCDQPIRETYLHTGPLEPTNQAYAVAKIAGIEGNLKFDTSKPDGMPVKELDVSRLNGIGWRAETDFSAALKATYQWFLNQQ